MVKHDKTMVNYGKTWWFYEKIWCFYDKTWETMRDQHANPPGLVYHCHVSRVTLFPVTSHAIPEKPLTKCITFSLFSRLSKNFYGLKESQSRFWTNRYFMAYIGKSVEQSYFFGASPLIKARAKKLRKRMTLCEKILWQELRKNRLEKYYFRRQHPISRFIVDFYCHELRLIIEVDGSIHDSAEHRKKDANRTAELENLGLHVIRFSNDEVLQNTRKVAWKIAEAVKR